MKNLSREYAVALFELSHEENKEDAILNEIRNLNQIFNSYPEYLKILSSYAVSRPEKIKLLDAVFKFRVDGYLLNFLKVVVQNHHVDILKKCFSQFEKIYNKKHNILKVTAYTSILMTARQMKDLTLKLESHTHKKVFLKNTVDSSLMGGIKIFYNEKFLDLSLESYFKELSDSIESVKK